MDAIIDMVMDLPAVEGEELFPMQDLLADPVLQDLGKAKQQAPCNEVRRSLRQHPASKGRPRKQQYDPVEREIKRQRRDEQRKVKATNQDSRRQRNKAGVVKRRAEIRAREGAQVSVFSREAIYVTHLIYLCPGHLQKAHGVRHQRFRWGGFERAIDLQVIR